MGIIYMIESPHGKKYIGQTIKTAEKRWKEHIIDALDPKKDHCKLLNASIRKYDPENFNLQVLVECNDEFLNLFEAKYVEEYNTLHPNGLNLKEGGGSKGKHIQETKDKIRQTLQGCDVPKERRLKLSATKKKNNLPMYVINHNVKGVHVGYRICNHPNGGEKKFTKSNLTMEANLSNALSHVKYLDSLLQPITIIPRTLPTYVQKYKDGYCVKFKGQTKYFVDTSLSKENKFTLAVQYLNELKAMETVQRLDDSG